MEALYGEGDNFITEYNFSSGPRLWNTEVFFGGRYTMDMQVPGDNQLWKSQSLRERIFTKILLTRGGVDRGTYWQGSGKVCQGMGFR